MSAIIYKCHECKVGFYRSADYIRHRNALIHKSSVPVKGSPNETEREHRERINTMLQEDARILGWEYDFDIDGNVLNIHELEKGEK